MSENLPEPKSRKESYLAKAAGMDVSIPEEPESRLEQYLEAIAENGGGGGGGGTSNFNQLTNRPKYNNTTMTGSTNIPEVKTYTAGSGLTLTGTAFSVNTTTIQPKLTAGTGIDITGNVISATGGSGPTVVQTTGTSTTDVMSQDATTKLVYPDIANNPYKQVIGEGSIDGTNKGLAINGILNSGLNSASIAIGGPDGDAAQIGSGGRAGSSIAIGNLASVSRGMQSIAIGNNAGANSGQNTGNNVALGYNSYAGAGSATSTVALGAYAQASRTGEVNVGAGTSGTGYNSTNYRVIGGVHDPVDDHDAATKGYVDANAGGGPTVVQTVGTSTTGVMSQDAVSKMIYPRIGSTYHDVIGIQGDNETPDSSAGAMSVGIGAGHRARGDNSIAIGMQATIYAAGAYSVAVGSTAKTEGHSRAVALGNAANAAFDNSVAIGTNAKTTRVGEVNVGADASGRGYNSTNYRVIGGVHDGQELHDCATVAQGNTLSASAPDSSTAGVLGQLWTDTTNMHTYQCTAISGSTYTWTQRW